MNLIHDLDAGFPHVVENHFPSFFNTFSMLNGQTLISSLIVSFSKILFMEHDAKKHNLNKQMAEFGIYILLQYLM